jgi:peptidoglycan/xylan/chitin deacetylase (PgdA/CDA1 family)
MAGLVTAEIVAAGLVSGAAAAMVRAVRAPSCTWLAPSHHRGVRSRRAIALTFDDGPSESTPMLLDLLAKHEVRATFFQCGANVRRLPGAAREAASRGHCIGNHTVSHPLLSLRSAEFIYSEIAEAQTIIADATGCEPRCFRPPYGVRWFGLGSAQKRLRLTSVLWSTIGKDWKWPTEAVASRLMAGAMNGAIFCLHDGRALQARPNIDNTLEAVARVIPMLRDQGFHFETVDEILCPTTT